jgi:hypothetical protein
LKRLQIYNGYIPQRDEGKGKKRQEGRERGERMKLKEGKEEGMDRKGTERKARMELKEGKHGRKNGKEERKDGRKVKAGRQEGRKGGVTCSLLVDAGFLAVDPRGRTHAVCIVCVYVCMYIMCMDACMDVCMGWHLDFKAGGRTEKATTIGGANSFLPIENENELAGKGREESRKEKASRSVEKGAGVC